jgi:phenylalanyl-tRNA synthetase alpha chain
MSETTEKIAALRAEAEDAIAGAADTAALEELRVKYLGRKAELTTILRGISDLPNEEKGPVGKEGNLARKALEDLLTARESDLDSAEILTKLAEDAVDVTLPGAPAREPGHLHLITRTRRLIEDTLVGLGFNVITGPEIEIDYYNFTALNHPPGHPARMAQDTLYMAPGSVSKAALDAARAAGGDGDTVTPDPELVMLRTHTSPMQVRAMEAQGPPIFVAVPGKAFRRDTIDATHLPMFHQMEGLAIAEGLTLADLQGTLEAMLSGLFGEGRKARMRPHFFPFTEPSVEFDVSCYVCDATGKLDDGSRCPLCKGIGWIEVGGAGMVDPNVLGFVKENGYDPEKVQGFAWGFGIERMAMLLHGLPDLRLFIENDVRVTGQFS